ncbi:MAG: hypothetical protein CMF62_10400 [Magnetococcales bacterium]|nr:hypothetical protein [Magnetococcales bacterium]
MKKSILLATSAIIASGAVAVNAQAVDVELYGQGNKGVMGYNVGPDSEIAIVDNDVSSTRFGLRGEHQLDHGLTASVLMEAELQTAARASDDLTNTGTAPTAAAADGFLERHARVGLAGQWGALFIGRTSSATDGITEIDLGAVSDIMNSATDRIGGGLIVDGTNSVSDLTDNIDGIAYDGGVGVDANEGDRADLVRYDSPIVNGLQARVAYVQDGDMDASVLYNTKHDELEIAAGLGYVKYNDSAANGAQSAIAGSVSVAHDNGVSVTAALGKRYFDDTTANDPKFGYVKVGYQMGNTGFAVDYARHEDSLVTAAAADTSVDAYGIGVQQDLGHGVSAAAYWRKIDANVNGVASERGVDVYGVNMRVKF